MTIEAMQAAVLDWYAAHARDLAFRRTTDPWAVLVSEVIAQQTQASRAAEAWERFIAHYPTPQVLAAASPAAVLRAWRGLGYNRRALALRAAAVAIVEDHAGVVPDSVDALVRLPGIGPYTARAVAAIAYDRPVAALDTNIRRVVGRAFLGGEDGLAPRALQAAADGFVPAGRAAAWTHALMDVGAAFCRKRDPRCGACPLATHCRYVATGDPDAASRMGAARRVGAAARPAASRPGAPTRSGGAARSRPPDRTRPPATPFPATRRWLRGRILDRLRDAPDGAWVTFDGPVGAHSVGAAHAALLDLAREGMVEVDPADQMRARLSLAT